MTFDWNEYLTLAEELALKNDEASKRTSISRAYYSVYHLAYERAKASGGTPATGSKHAWCWNQFQKTPDAICRELASWGIRMKKRRIDADYYNTAISRLDDEVQTMLSLAHNFRAKIALLDPRYPHP
jgi:hypothetical protein